MGIFLIASIPCLWSLARAAYRAEAVLKVVQEDLPQTSALIRLSGLEVVEAVSEMSRLGSDLSSGVRSIATLATETEQGIRLGISGTEVAIRKGLMPAMAKAEGSLRQAMEAELLQRARLNHTKAAIEGIGKAAETAAEAARRARVGVQAARLAVGAGAVVRRVMERAAETNIAKLKRGRRRIDATQSIEE